MSKRDEFHQNFSVCENIENQMIETKITSYELTKRRIRQLKNQFEGFQNERETHIFPSELALGGRQCCLSKIRMRKRQQNCERCMKKKRSAYHEKRAMAVSELVIGTCSS